MNRILNTHPFRNSSTPSAGRQAAAAVLAALLPYLAMGAVLLAR